MPQLERQMRANCEIEYAASWSDQSLPCGKRAVARCADCGTSICSDCLTECSGQTFCVQCYDYHVAQSCVKKPVQKERDSVVSEFRGTPYIAW